MAELEKYLIGLHERHICWLTVEAVSAAQAIEFAEDGAGEQHGSEYVETLSKPPIVKELK